jgi:hyperosmotically inducible protein
MKRSCAGLVMFLALGMVLSGCGTAYKVAVDKRSLGTQATDEKITMNVRNKLGEDDALKSLSFSTYCYEGNVYLVGEYDTRNRRPGR